VNFEIILPYLGCTANDHVNWWQKAARAKDVREATKLQAQSQRHEKATASTVSVVYRVVWPKGKRRMDWDNLATALKPLQDGLVDAGVIWRDGPDWVTAVSYEQSRGTLPGIVVVVSVTPS
jgi:hypothetical protein